MHEEAAMKCQADLRRTPDGFDRSGGSTQDVEEPLTPAHLLTGKRLLSLPDARHDSQGFMLVAISDS